jgi:hypothetical protein
MKHLSRILMSIAFVAPLAIGSAVSADDNTSPTGKQDVTMDQLPSAVKSTVQREGKGKNVESMTKSSDKNGVVAYEIKYLDQNRETTIDVATNGKVLTRHIRSVEAQPGQASPSSPSPSSPSSPPSDTNPNDTHPNDTHSNDMRSNDTRPNDTRPNDTHSNDTPQPPKH